MAQIHDRKSNFYSQKQSVRDELSAPQYLESAGDELIKRLAKKQTNTSTSLQEQLQIVQNFEKGFELNPDNQKGISSLEDFKKHVSHEKEETSSRKLQQIQDVNELMKITGLTRHELELGLCEKPTSTVSRLYMFAMRNKRHKNDAPHEPEKLLSNHPINHLKEIEEECFGRSKSEKIEKKVKKKKHRKRRKKTQGCPKVSSPPSKSPIVEEPVEVEEKPTTSSSSSSSSSSRPSLWDVKDMKKWSESKKIGCEPQAFYTIKNGKIIKLETEGS